MSGVNVTGTQLIGLVLGVTVTAATAALLRYTKLGAGMRAIWFRGRDTPSLSAQAKVAEDAAAVRAALRAWGLSGL